MKKIKISTSIQEDNNNRMRNYAEENNFTISEVTDEIFSNFFDADNSKSELEDLKIELEKTKDELEKIKKRNKKDRKKKKLLLMNL